MARLPGFNLPGQPQHVIVQGNNREPIFTRHKATQIDSETYLLTCYRYIELSPVRAMDNVNHPSAYPWSSYRFNALGEGNSLLVTHPEYRRLDKTRAQRQQAYRALFQARIPQLTLDEIRQATNKAWILGNDQFKAMIEQKLARRPALNPRWRPKIVGISPVKQYQSSLTSLIPEHPDALLGSVIAGMDPEDAAALVAA